MAANTRTVQLAHPLDRKYAEDLNAGEIRDYKPGEHITVPVNQLMRLVNAGLLRGVDPKDGDAVRKVFLDDQPTEPAGPAAEAQTVTTTKTTKTSTAAAEPRKK